MGNGRQGFGPINGAKVVKKEAENMCEFGWVVDSIWYKIENEKLNLAMKGQFPQHPYYSKKTQCLRKSTRTKTGPVRPEDVGKKWLLRKLDGTRTTLSIVDEKPEGYKLLCSPKRKKQLDRLKPAPVITQGMLENKGATAAMSAEKVCRLYRTMAKEEFIFDNPPTIESPVPDSMITIIALNGGEMQSFQVPATQIAIMKDGVVGVLDEEFEFQKSNLPTSMTNLLRAAAENVSST